MKIRVFLMSCLLSAAAGTASAGIDRSNVLFIVVDDLNDWVSHLGGHPQAATPNIDAFAARGTTFTNAHCVAPACNPSRAALMSGMRPFSSGIYQNEADWKHGLADVLTLNEHFMAEGYDVIAGGKIYHGTTGVEGKWTEYWKRPGDAPTEKNKNGLNKSHFDWGPIDCDDDGMGDHALVSWAVEQLKEEREKPLFLAVGFVKPHLPFYAPKKYFDQFPVDQIQLPKVKKDDLADFPPAALKMARPDGDHATVTAAELEWKLAVQAYLATIAFVDHEVGRLMRGLDESPAAKNTIVVFWGDHGWHLGEKPHWRKFALWNDTTHVPFFIVAPGLTKAGSVCEAPVDLLGIYPTLCNLTGVSAPEHLQGANFRPLLADSGAKWELPAISTHGRGNHMIQSRHLRYIRYENGDEEFYDHRDDPNEWENLASTPKAGEIREKLEKWIPAAEVNPVRKTGSARKKKKTK
ncbi:MAG: arylsulfatase A-like enzyme [Verrucomicrobiales bacterium]|jgi:arylsulfatase A-like enzyme